jgi:hypothetical protein
MSININILSNFNGSGFDKLSRELDRLNTPMEKLGAVSRTLAPAAQIGVVALTALGASAVTAASDMVEAQTAVNQIFGKSAEAIKEFSESGATNLGQSSTQILNGAKTFGIFGQAAGLAAEDNVAFSKELIALAADLASFNNTSVDDAITALGAGLRGENEPLRRFGVLLDDATLKAQALEMGIYDGNGSLTSQQKILAANAEIFKQTNTQQGDFARTSDGLANSQRILKAELENLSISVGTALLPVIEAVVPILKDFMEFLGANSNIVLVLAGIFGALAVAILAVNFALNANPIVKVITLIAFLAAGVAILINYLVTLYGGWDKLFKDISGWLANFVIGFKTALSDIGSFFASVFAGLGAIAKGALNGILGFVEGYINFIIRGINGLLDLINTVLGAGKAIGINLQIPKIPTLTVPRLADGGIVMPRPGGVLANLAEGGQAEAVIPLDRLGSMNGKGGNTYNITVTGGVGSGSTIGKSIVDAIKAYERSSGAVWQSA